MRVSVPIDYTLDVRRNRFLWRRRLHVWDFLGELGGGNDIISFIIALPGLFMALVATAELLVAILLLPVALVARATGLIGSDLLTAETFRPAGSSVRRERTRVLRLPSGAATDRFIGALAPHIRGGGRLGDPLVGRWFAQENGRIASGPNPWTA